MSDLISRCERVTGSMLHIWWSCPDMKHGWDAMNPESYLLWLHKIAYSFIYIHPYKGIVAPMRLAISDTGPTVLQPHADKKISCQWPHKFADDITVSPPNRYNHCKPRFRLHAATVLWDRSLKVLRSLSTISRPLRVRTH